MRKFIAFKIILILLIPLFLQAQKIDSLKYALRQTENDTVQFNLLIKIGELYTFNNADSSILYIKKATALANNKNNALWEAHTNLVISLYFFVIGDFASALNFSFKNINNYDQYQNALLLSYSTTFTGIIYSISGNNKEAINFAFRSIKLRESIPESDPSIRMHFSTTKNQLLVQDFMTLATAYLNLNNIDSALIYGKKAYEVNINNNINYNYPLYRLALIHTKMGNMAVAINLLRRAVSMAIKENIMKDVIDNYIGMSELFRNTRQSDSSIFYAKKVLALNNETNYKKSALDASLLLSSEYEKMGMNDSAFHYYKYAIATKDSLFNQEKIQQIQSFAFKEELREQELRQKAIAQQTHYRNKIKTFIILGVAITFLLTALFLWNNNRQKQKANALLQQKNEEVIKTLTELKSTQAQLIQKEKMASLGELTAGIAHEIQNPLNFVNNFSEVNAELLEELQAELKNGNIQAAFESTNEIKENELKIAHHGKRADAIVKSMLQHSRASSGEKQPTNINALAEEYLRLAYQGQRAINKEFNANLVTDFDNYIVKIEVVPQEFGRVLLNLFNNAFYATQQKKAQLNGQYQPEVKVSTLLQDDRIEIRVRDNGTGIPVAVKNRIFQPFFTTKPTGQGTGLGLSLSYDIITKGHGGDMKVETKEGEYSEFIIAVPKF